MRAADGAGRYRLAQLTCRVADMATRFSLTLELKGMGESNDGRQRIDWRGADLRGVNMAGVNLENADLRAAEMSGVNFTGTNLRNADLRGANLQGANLQNANLYGAKMQGVEAFNADFRGADLRLANLGGAYLEGAMMPPPAVAERRPLKPSEIAQAKTSPDRAQANGHAQNGEQVRRGQRR